MYIKNMFIYWKVLLNLPGDFELTYLELKELKADEKILRKYSDIMRQWTLPVVLAIGKTEGAGFNLIKKMIPGINSTTLSKTLHQFEKYSLIERVLIPSRPVTVKYNLTASGREFYNIILNITEFMDKLPSLN